MCKRAICSFPLFQWAMWANHSGRSHHLPKMSDHEQIAQVTHQKWANRSLFEGITDLLIFSQKPSNSLRNQWEHSQPCNSLIFGERPERITHDHSFLVSNLSNLLTSLIKKEEISKSLAFFRKPTKNVPKKHFSQILLSKSLVFCEQKSKWAICSEKKSNLLIRSIIMSDLSKLLTVAHLSWANWGIHSQLLFWHQRPERFAHSHSFVLIDLSKLLTVAHMIWAIWLWANEQ